jgi:DNA-binding GntR family transcriptional regulator
MKNSQDKAYTFIKKQIININIKPGHHLRAQEFAKKLKLSRTPVREALGRLEQEGLVIKNGGWGYLVRPITFKEISDLFNVRESLEVQAALEALPNLDKESLSAMEAVLRKASELLKNEQFEEFRATNRRFHLLIAAATGNDLLHRLLLMIDDRIRVVGALHLNRRKERAKEILAENMAILGALRQQDPIRLRAVVLAHIRNSRAGLAPLEMTSPVRTGVPLTDISDGYRENRKKR